MWSTDIYGVNIMNEIKAIEAVDTALSNLDPDARLRVLGWAQLKYGSQTAGKPPNEQAQPLRNSAQAPPLTSKAGGLAKAKAAKKTKTIISMDKSLNLSPQGKSSAVQFATQKAPASVTQKCVVAVYYLRETIELEKVSVQAVFTFFKHLGWPIPTDLKNTLQQAGSAGWLDTADGQDIKLTSLGENLVEHSLPAKAKVK
jgi:hypothetical protein